MTEFDFSQPQRQSKVGVVVMFFYTLQKFVRALGPLFLVVILKFDSSTSMTFGLITAGLLILVGIISYLKYLNFTFHLDEEKAEFVVTEGVLNKTRTSIQINKIQQVNINQSFLQRLIGVYEVVVDTAGSSEDEANIRAVSHNLALALKTRLLGNRKVYLDSTAGIAQDEFSDADLQAKPFIKISLATLFKVGITSNYARSLSLLLLFFVTIYEQFYNFTGRDLIDDDMSEKADSRILEVYNSGGILTAVLIFLIFIFSIVVLINLVRIVIKYFDYRIEKQKGSLLLAFGLLGRKNTIVRPEKVQTTTVTQNYFQRKMDILEVRIRQAMSDESQGKKKVIEIPGCNRAESQGILNLLYETLPAGGAILLPNYRRLIFSLFISIVIPLCIFLALGYWADSSIFEYSYMIPVYILIVGTVKYFGYRNYRLTISDNFIIKRSGAWDVSNQIIESSKIQAVTASQLFWHKGPDVGTLTIHTAAGSVSFGVTNYTVVKRHINKWLYDIETSDKNWM